MRVLTVLKAVLFPIGLLALAGIALAIGFGDPVSRSRVTPVDSASLSSFGMQIDAAMSDFDVNNARADSAPKQQVVNGWVARDLLQIIARQQASSNDGLSVISRQLEQLANPAAQPIDERTIRLAVVAVLTLVWWALWSAVPTRRTRAFPPPPAASALPPPAPTPAV